jgi:hypothetical protein
MKGATTMTITQKRATLYREWLLATLGNDEDYYHSTLMCGIPDGDDEETVMTDLKDGFYDDDIDDTIEVYTRAKKRYAKGGYYVNRKLFNNEDEALQAAGYAIPERIYKHR